MKLKLTLKLMLLIVCTFVIFVSYGQQIDGWKTVGDANWAKKDGVIQADKGKGFLISTKSYKDVTISLEFWTSEKAVSGVFIRCSDEKQINNQTAYKININDSKPEFSTGSIVNYAQTLKVIDTANKWNTYEISAKGTHLTVKLNGILVVDTSDGTYASGPVALQMNTGAVKFKNVSIK